MNERGIISLTALCMMFILALMIAGTANIAARQADMTRFFKVETQLQNAAESAFNETVVKLLKDSTYNEHLRDDTDIESKNRFNVTDPDWTNELYINDIKVNVYLKKYHIKTEHSPNNDEDTHCFRIVIMTLAEKDNYNNGQYPVYRSVYGYLERKRIRNRDTNDIVYENDYEFKEYLY